jgi:hypothetical protein
LPAEKGLFKPRVCTYCGAVETAVRPESRAAAFNPTPRQQARFWGPGVVLGGLVVAALQIAHWQPGKVPPQDAPPERPSVSEPPVDVSTEAARPDIRTRGGLLLVRADQDNHEDLLAVCSMGDETTPEHWLAAINGDDGTELWRRPWDSTADPASTLRAVVADKLLLVSPEGQLLALDPGTGNLLWQRAVGPSAHTLCEGEQSVGVTSAGRFLAFALATGAPIRADQRRCRPAYTSRSPAPNFSYVDGATLNQWLPRGDSLHAVRGLAPHQGVARLLLGTEPRSTAEGEGPASVGLIANRQWLWRSVVGSGGLGAELTDPPIAAVRRSRVVVPYLAQHRTALGVASFDLTDGRRQWDQLLFRVAPPATVTASDVLLTMDGKVFVRGDRGHVWAARAEDGVVVWTLGRP